MVFQQSLAAQVLSRLIGKLDGVRLKEGSEKHRSRRKNHRKSRRWNWFSHVFPCFRLAREWAVSPGMSPDSALKSAILIPGGNPYQLDPPFKQWHQSFQRDVKSPMFLFNRAIQQVWFPKKLSKVWIYDSVYSNSSEWLSKNRNNYVQWLMITFLFNDSAYQFQITIIPNNYHESFQFLCRDSPSSQSRFISAGLTRYMSQVWEDIQQVWPLQLTPWRQRDKHKLKRYSSFLIAVSMRILYVASSQLV